MAKPHRHNVQEGGVAQRGAATAQIIAGPESQLVATGLHVFGAEQRVRRCARPRWS